MTIERALEIERQVFYARLDLISDALTKCDDNTVAFEVGRQIGFMHKALKDELDKEVENDGKID